MQQLGQHSRNVYKGGRKFELLVRIFGLDILRAMPEVSVSRVVQVKLEDLTALLTGSMGSARINKILQKIAIS